MKPSWLLAEYGSPAYVYELADLRSACASLRSALPEESRIYYSLKANPHPMLVRTLGEFGCGAEVSSTGELDQALSAGILPDRCLWTGPGKSVQEIEHAIRQGIVLFSVDSAYDLQKVTEGSRRCGTPVQAILRVNPDRSVPGPGLTMTGIPSQFGIDADWIRRAPEEFAGSDWVRVIGFHMYMGTNIADGTALLRTFELGMSLAAELAGMLGIQLKLVNLGGGFPHPYASPGDRMDLSGLKLPLADRLDRWLPGWRQGTPVVAFESGRYLAAGAGTLYSTVQDVKVSRGRTYLVLDSGIHHLGGMTGLRRLVRSGVGVVPLVEHAEPPLQDVEVVGPLCTPLDHWTHCPTFPAVRPGDVVSVPNVGAYGLTASLIAFLSREAPVEIVLDHGRVVEVSRLVLHRHHSEKGDFKRDGRAGVP